MKQRTSLAIEARVRRAAEKAARSRGVSLSRFVTEALVAHLEKTEGRKRFPRNATVRGGRFLTRDHDALAFGE